MLYNTPEFSSSDITYWPRSLQVTIPALREEIPETIRKVSTECAEFMWCMPLRYSGLPVRRRLIRMMLTFQKYGEARGNLDSRGRDAFTPAADYARSVIDTAMLRGELRCRPSDAMTRAFLTQTEELRSIMAGIQQNKALLRKEVRRRTADFLWQYAARAEA